MQESDHRQCRLLRARRARGRTSSAAAAPPESTMKSRAASFDHHLVGNREQSRRHLDAKRSRRFQVDDEFEFGRLQHRQVGGVCTLPLRMLPV